MPDFVVTALGLSGVFQIMPQARAELRSSLRPRWLVPAIITWQPVTCYG